MSTSGQIEKACSRCGEIKPLGEYCQDKRHKDGRTSQCIICNRIRDKKYMEGAVAKEKMAIRQRARYARDPDIHRERRSRYRKTHDEPSSHERSPFKERARRILREAVRSGKVTKPTECQDCGLPHEVIHGHHEDYSKPLSVDWLCVSCHAARHRKYPDPARLSALQEGE